MRFARSMLIVNLLISASLVGCISDEGTSVVIDPESLVEVAQPCSQGSTAISQSMTEITVNGESRLFRLTAPSSDVGVELPIIIAFHGGGGEAEDFQQQSEFDQLAEEEKFIMAYAIAEDDRTASEGEWYLNTAATSRDDNDFTEAIVDELSKSYCVDQDRLYAIGYSLGSMFTYEIAC